MGPDLGDVMLGHVWILDSNLRKPNSILWWWIWFKVVPFTISIIIVIVVVVIDGGGGGDVLLLHMDRHWTFVLIMEMDPIWT